MCLLWKTRMHRPERITPADEIRNTLAIVRESILPALSDIYDGWSEQFETATPLRLGSWLGGDRDGHPGVTGETLRLALRSQARLILNHYSDEVRRLLWFDMAASGELTSASCGRRCWRWPGRPRTPTPTARTSPIAKALQEIWDRLAATADKIAGEARKGSTHGRTPSPPPTSSPTLEADAPVGASGTWSERVVGVAAAP